MNANLKDFKLLQEDANSYLMTHPNGKQMTIPKKGLSEKAHKMIKMCSGGMAMAKGGKVQKFAGTDDPSDSQVQSDDSNSQAPVVNIDLTGQPPQANQPVGTDTVLAPGQAGVPQYVSPAPPPIPTTPQQGAGQTNQPLMPDINQSLKEEKKAITAGATAEAGLGTAQANDIAEIQGKVDNLPSQNNLIARNETIDNSLMEAYKSKSIDPDRYMHNMDTGSKITAALALFLGGLSTPFTHQGNPALAVMQNAIQRDIESQKADVDKAHTLWSMNRAALGNDLAANTATQNQMYTALKYKLAQAASHFQGPIAQAKAQQLNASIDQQIAQNNFKLSFLQGPTKEAISDPNYPEKAVANSGMFKTPEEQKAALDEIAYRKNLKSVANPILDAFDAIGLHRPADLNPMQDTPEQQHFEALMNTTVKEQEGTARQAAFDSIKANLMKHVGDSDARTQQRREAVIQYLNSKQAAPFTASRGLNLDQYPSTAWTPPAAANGLQQQKIQRFMQDNPQVKDRNQAQQILQKAGKL